MEKRTQLNINISPDLLEKLKKASIKSGKTLTALVSETLTKSVISNGSDEMGLNSIEKRLNSIEEAISYLNTN